MPDIADWEVTIARVLGRFPLQSSDKEDCRQIIWHALLTNECPRSGMAEITAWIATLSRNKIVDFLRRQRRGPRCGPIVDVACRVEEYGEFRRRASELIWAALVELEASSDPRSFLVFFMRWFEDWSIVEAAQVLGLDPGQARQRHHRMKSKFRRLLEAPLEPVLKSRR